MRDLRRRQFDLAILLPNSFRAALMAWLAGARRRVGYDRDGRGFLLTDRVPVRNLRRKVAASTSREGIPAGGCARKDSRTSVRGDFRTGATRDSRISDLQSSTFNLHPSVILGSTLPVKPSKYVPMPLVEYYAELTEAIGCDRPGDRLELFTTPDCDESVDERLSSLEIGHMRPLVVLSPGARYGAAKCWMPDRFAAVADRLVESEDAAVIVTCGPGEEQIARTIGAHMNRPGHVFDNPRLTLGELKSLIRRCDLLICNDAGPRHFAKAFGVPVVTVFGPTHPDWTATSYAAERIVRINVDCGPCQQRTCPLGHLNCMTGVTVEMVFEAAAGLLHDRVKQGVG
jgi:ADP-heptose:LPS heptosyltransferase